MVIDYRYLNKNTVHDPGPIPIIDDMVQTMGAYQMYSVLDLTHGYHQIPLKEDKR